MDAIVRNTRSRSVGTSGRNQCGTDGHDRRNAQSTTSPDLTERRSWRCPEALQGVPAGLNIRVVLKRSTEVLDGFLASAQRLEDVASWWGTLLARRCSRR